MRAEQCVVNARGQKKNIWFWNLISFMQVFDVQFVWFRETFLFWWSRSIRFPWMRKRNFAWPRQINYKKSYRSRNIIEFDTKGSKSKCNDQPLERWERTKPVVKICNCDPLSFYSLDYVWSVSRKANKRRKNWRKGFWHRKLSYSIIVFAF